MPVIDHNGRKIGYLEAGNGSPAVLLPPGATPAAAWRRLSECLAPRFRTLAVNFSGYADTEPFAGPEPMTVDDEADAVMAVLSGTDEPAFLVGHSYGGAIALRLALRFPERFASLVLIEPAIYPLLQEAGERDLFAEVEAVNRRYIAQVGCGETETAFQTYFDYYNNAPGAWAALPDQARARLLSIAGTIAIGLAAAHANPTTLAQCASLAMPVLLIFGTETDAVHGRLTEIVAAEVPGSRLERVAGAGHMLSLTHPEAVAGLIAGHASRR